MAFTLLVNGIEHNVDVAPEETLLSVLRNNLELTGTKYGCGEGQCGACTVLIEGSAARSCRMQVTSVAGKKITTVEGLRRGDRLHPVQQAFLETEAFQCGYCTPGMVLSATALLERNPNVPVRSLRPNSGSRSSGGCASPESEECVRSRPTQNCCSTIYFRDCFTLSKLIAVTSSKSWEAACWFVPR